MDRAGLEAQIRANPVEGTPAEMRSAFARRIGHRTDVPLTTLHGCDGRMFGEGVRLALWLHGGGYVFGSSETHSAAASRVARSAGMRVFVPDYPLAPETRWRGIADAMGSLLDRVGPVAVIGDSAGGHLALSLALRRPGAVRSLALISPNTDRTGRSRTRGSTRDLMNDDAGDRALGDMALAGIADDDPRASPLLADLRSLPPVYLTAATEEVLLDDTLLLARALGLARVPVEMDIRPGLFHLWPLWPDIIAEARHALDRVGQLLARG